MFALRYPAALVTARSVLSGLTTRGTGSFKSPLHVENAYGSKPEDIANSPPPPAGTDTFTGYIPMKELIIKHCKSSGPGGQNGDKVNTKAEVRFHLDSAAWIPGEARERLKKLCASSINKEGFIIFSSERTRKQFLNTADCIDRIRSVVFEACKKPPEITEDTKLMLKKRLERAAAARLREKRHNSQLRRERAASQNF
ncbi:peptidyl-tRNA hydrolase ICT1, mitochondrial [Galendromus occidentalis]|uniref:Large ribosomal subunit protein mL62 n=1 Tax=Galendromus occidentalis TaxID=34638 RepID=A0AAJ6VYI4_9ACAR|nr:peptidyl-tRNA hydrolase ICT1, mitochondrial [Galendromus occidentalis]